MDNDDLTLIWLLNYYKMGSKLLSMVNVSNFDLSMKCDLFNMLQVWHYISLGGLAKNVHILLAH
jgi:hypothetical protein